MLLEESVLTFYIASSLTDINHFIISNLDNKYIVVKEVKQTNNYCEICSALRKLYILVIRFNTFQIKSFIVMGLERIGFNVLKEVEAILM